MNWFEKSNGTLLVKMPTPTSKTIEKLRMQVSTIERFEKIDKSIMRKQLLLLSDLAKELAENQIEIIDAVSENL